MMIKKLIFEYVKSDENYENHSVFKSWHVFSAQKMK